MMSAQVESESDDPTSWVCLYNTELHKWLVTNDIVMLGLNAYPETIEVIGYATDMDAVFFLIYEHQISLGLEHTVLDDIRKIKQKHRNEVNQRTFGNTRLDAEWHGDGWNEPATPEQPFAQGFIRRNGFVLGTGAINWHDLYNNDTEEDENNG